MNLHDICLQVNNFFTKTVEVTELTFIGNKITNFSNDYLIGQYVHVEGSVLNDGVYKITNITATEITVNTSFVTEASKCTLYGLAIPKAFLELAEQIIQNGAEGNAQSETVSRYSVNHGAGGNGWQNVYKNALNKWRKLRW